MDETSYLNRARAAFGAIVDLFDEVDAEDADVEEAGDVIKITFADGAVCVVNTQRPARQIWLAAVDRAWHFDWDEATERWLDDKGGGDELLAVIRAVTSARGVTLPGR